MASIKKWQPKVGDKVITTKKFGGFGGYFEPGSVVTIIDQGPRGYDISDESGNRVTECGWTGFKKYEKEEE